jgi:hypothetical protein
MVRRRSFGPHRHHHGVHAGKPDVSGVVRAFPKRVGVVADVGAARGTDHRKVKARSSHRVAATIVSRSR